MESICRIGAIMQQMTTIISDPQPAERWLKYEPIIRADLIAAGIDPDDPPTLVRALAKTVTRESRKGIFLTGGTGSGKSRRMQKSASVRSRRKNSVLPEPTEPRKRIGKPCR